MSRVLVLGTMPGEASLRARQYYGHPRNLFWRIVGELLGLDPASPYQDRVALVRSSHIAVWDVLNCCTRAGSLDSAIDRGSVVPNDFDAFLEAHPRIHRIFFNGAKADHLFARLVRPRLALRPEIKYVRLPSTSPANASLSWSQKLQAWQAVRL
jgi:double-stranded uracil-DNA glycosylase